MENEGVRAPPTGTVKNLTELLILHSSEGNSAEVKWLLTSEKLRGEVLNTKIFDCSALSLAVKGGYTTIVTYLIDAGASIYVLDNEHKTPLMIAAEKGHVEVIKILMTNKADKTMRLGIHRNNANGVVINKQWTALMFAVANDNYAAVEQLLTTTPERTVNQQDSKKNTALLLACAKICEQDYESSNVRMVEILLGKGADVNAVNEEGFTALEMAAKSNNTKLIAALLKVKGIDVDKITFISTDAASAAATPRIERSALYIACENFHYESVRLLLKRTGDFNALRFLAQQIMRTDVTSTAILLCQQAFRDGSPYLPSVGSAASAPAPASASASASSASSASSAPAAASAASASAASASAASGAKEALRKKLGSLEKRLKKATEEFEETDPEDEEEYNSLMEEIEELEREITSAKAALAAGGRRTRKQKKQ